MKIELQFIAAAADTPETLPSWFASRSQQFGDRLFLSVASDSGVEHVSYREAGRRVAGVTEWLVQHDFGKGDRIVCYLGDATQELLWFILACATCGVVLVPLPSAYLPETMREIAARCGARAVLTSVDLAAAGIAGALPILTLDAAAPDGALVIESLPVANPSQQLRMLAGTVELDDLFLIQPTSGSSGTPKLVRMHHGHYAWGTRMLADAWTAEGDGATLGILLTGALTHGPGQFALCMAAYLGARLCIPRGVDIGVEWSDAEPLAASTLIVVPRVIRALVQQHRARYGAAADTTPLLGGHLRRIYTGGALIDDATVRWLEARGVEVLEVFGATETCFVAFTRSGRRRSGYTGEILPEVEVKVADDGELLVRSPYAARGFEGDEITEQQAFDADGYYRTGDLVAIEDGYLRVLGRKRDVLHSMEGSYVYPSHIEDRIEANFGFASQVVLLGDEKPYVVALIVLSDPAPASDDPFGYLRPELHPQLHARVREAIARLNLELDSFARIQAFGLFAAPFPSSVYRALPAGKVARNRANALELYDDFVTAMYADDAVAG